MPSVLHQSQAGGSFYIYTFTYHIDGTKTWLREPGAASIATNKDGVEVDEFGLPKIPMPNNWINLAMHSIMPEIGRNIGLLYSLYYIQILLWYSPNDQSQKSDVPIVVDKSIMCEKTYSENFSEMAAVGEQQQDEDAAELTFPKVAKFG